MKKRSILIIALALVMCVSLLAVTACKEDIDFNAQSLSIANATDLMAKWNVGEADRTVEVTLTDGLKDKTVSVTTEPEGVISVDGMTLHAVKNGTATVTATVTLDDEHSYSDEVEITVTYNYQLQITNKNDLTKAFRIGEADKTVQISLPEAIKDNPVTITSSKTDVVSIVNGKIHAVAKGEATITASTTLNGSTFKDSFKVTVWGDFDLVVNNKAALEQPIGKYADPVAVNWALVEAGDYTAKDVTITSSKPDIAKIEDGKLVPVSIGNTVVTVACGDKTVTINVIIEVLPELKIAAFDESVMYYTGEVGCTLPAVTMATSSEDKNVEVEILVSDGATLSGDKTKVTANDIGKYTVTYRFDDPNKGEKKVEITVSFIDEIIGATGAHAGENKQSSNLDKANFANALVEEDEGYKQIITSATDSTAFAKLNVSASRYYYAEATFEVTNPHFDNTSLDALVAMGHFNATSERSVLLSNLNTRSGDFLTLNFVFNKNKSIFKSDSDKDSTQTCMYAYKLFRSRHITRLDEDVQHDQDSTGNGTHTALVTIAVARDGDYFYTFINGQYVMCVTFKEFRNVDTIPAILGVTLAGNEVEISNVKYYDVDNGFQTKLNDVLGANKEKMIVPYAHSDSYDKTGGTHNYQESFGDNVLINTDVQNRGMAFNYVNGVNGNANDQNNSAVGLNMYLDGNFTFQYDYKRTDVKAINSTSTTSANSSILELKDWLYGNDILRLGVSSANNNADTKLRLDLIVNGFKAQDGWAKDARPATNDAGTTVNNIDTDATIRFTLTRVLLEDHAVYIMTATVLDDNGNPTDVTYTRIIPWGNVPTGIMASNNYQVAQDRWDRHIQMYWRNSGYSGEFSNISWSILPDDVNVAALVEAAENAQAIPVNATEVDTTYPVEGYDTPTKLYKFTCTADKLTNGVMFNLGKELQAGEYIVKITALGDSVLSTKDLSELTLLNKTITVAEGAQYLQLSNVIFGNGTYEFQLTRIPEPVPVRIINGEALQQYWKLGDDDRTVELKLGNDVTNDDVTIVCSDPTIVEVGEGNVLKALKAGKVTIYAQVGEGDNAYKTEEIELKVHYNYTLAITNKDALTATYRAEEADRTVETSFTEGVEHTVVITSSDETVIKITEDGKLQALKKGVATITVTVTIDADNVFTDTVEITVLGAFDFTITNAEAFNEPMAIIDGAKEVTITLTEAGDYTIANFTATSSQEDIATVAIDEDGKIMITPVKAGRTTITLTCGGVDKTLDVVVVSVVLKVEADKVTHYTNEQFDIPAILSAKDDKGEDATALVVVTASEGMTVTKNDDGITAVAEEIGEYTLTYTLAIEGCDTVTAKVTVTIVEDLYGTTGAHKGDNNVDDELGAAAITSTLKLVDEKYVQQTAFGTDALVFAQPKNAQALTKYYYEATFDIGTVKDVVVALAHFQTGADNSRHALLSALNVENNNYVGIDVTFNKQGNLDRTLADGKGQEYVYGLNIFKTRNYNKEQLQTTHVTIAIARDGDYFYTFIDGHYYNCVTFKDFRSGTTVPAIVGANLRSGEVQVSNIVYLTAGDELDATMIDLLGVNKEKMIVPFTDDWDGSAATDTNYGNAYNGKTEIKTNTETEANVAESRGLYFDYVNNGNGRYDSGVSPQVYLDGNFTFQWEYEFEKATTLSTYVSTQDKTDKYRSILEFRSATLPTGTTNYSAVQLGTATDTDSATKKQQLEFNTKAYAKTTSGSTNIYLEWVEPIKDTIARGTKIKFTVTRLLKEDHAEYILTAVLADGTAYTRVVHWGNIADTYMKNANTKAAQKEWAKSVLPYWCNSGFSGKFSNIKWELLPDNATTAEFVENSDNAVAVNGGNFTNIGYIAKDIVLDLGEENGLEAGKYTITVTVNRDLPNTAALTITSDPTSAEIYTTTVTVGDNKQYLKLSDIALGHGSYTITFTKVVVEPEPTPEVPETPVTPEA